VGDSKLQTVTGAGKNEQKMEEKENIANEKPDGKGKGPALSYDRAKNARNYKVKLN